MNSDFSHLIVESDCILSITSPLHNLTTSYMSLVGLVLEDNIHLRSFLIGRAIKLPMVLPSRV